MGRLEYALPLLIVAVALAIWLVIHRQYKRNIRRRGESPLAREKEFALLEQSNLLTPEERRKLRAAIGKKIKQTEVSGEQRTRKPPIDIRELEDKYMPEDRPGN